MKTELKYFSFQYEPHWDPAEVDTEVNKWLSTTIHSEKQRAGVTQVNLHTMNTISTGLYKMSGQLFSPFITVSIVLEICY